VSDTRNRCAHGEVGLCPVCWYERQPKQPLVRLVTETRHPETYVLINEQDNTRWRGTRDGRWVPDDRAAT
jgi:hypothetical protein